MSNKAECCESCLRQWDHKPPHHGLKRISRFDTGSVYSCNQCGSCWLHGSAGEWLILREGTEDPEMVSGC